MNNQFQQIIEKSIQKTFWTISLDGSVNLDKDVDKEVEQSYHKLCKENKLY